MNTYRYNGIVYSQSGGVYPVESDTLLLADSAMSLMKPGLKMIDMGCGTGLLSLMASRGGLDVISVDREPAALLLLRYNHGLNGTSSRLILSNLFEGLPRSYLGYMDLITFNPPYLPDDGGLIDTRNDLPLIGGRSGYEIMKCFLKECDRFLAEDGSILIVRPREWSWDGKHIEGSVFREEEIISTVDLDGELLDSVRLVRNPP